MSNIDRVFETIAPYKVKFEKDSISRKRVLFLQKGPGFSILRKGLDLHILRSRKEPGLWTINNACNKLLP